MQMSLISSFNVEPVYWLNENFIDLLVGKSQQ